MILIIKFHKYLNFWKIKYYHKQINFLKIIKYQIEITIKKIFYKIEFF